MEWLIDFVRTVFGRLVDAIGLEWTLPLVAAVIVVALYLAIGRGR